MKGVSDSLTHGAREPTHKLHHTRWVAMLILHTTIFSALQITTHGPPTTSWKRTQCGGTHRHRRHANQMGKASLSPTTRRSRISEAFAHSRKRRPRSWQRVDVAHAQRALGVGASGIRKPPIGKKLASANPCTFPDRKLPIKRRAQCQQILCATLVVSPRAFGVICCERRFTPAPPL